jgi:ribosomal RNA small subunit methyltransferase A
MPRLGQHFLKNPSVTKKTVEMLALVQGDIVIEIGTGHGELTAELLESPASRIIVIEKDPDLVAALYKRFQEKEIKNNAGRLDIREGDALIVLPKIISELFGNVGNGNGRGRNETGGSEASRNWKLTGNIPYYITGKLLRTVSDLNLKPERATLMVQREVAERICAVPPDMNRLAASVQFWAEASIVVRVPRKDFSPAPNVDSAVIALAPTRRGAHGTNAEKGKQSVSPERYYETLRSLFAQPRKTILNNLAEAHLAILAGTKTEPVIRTSREEIKEKIAKTLEGIHILPDNRPQNLAVEDIVAIAEAF